RRRPAHLLRPQPPRPAHPRRRPPDPGPGDVGPPARSQRLWQVDVTADVAGLGRQQASGAFEVLDKHKVPAPGDPVLPTENLTVASTAVPRAAVDSRAGAAGEVPDPELPGASP